MKYFAPLLLTVTALTACVSSSSVRCRPVSTIVSPNQVCFYSEAHYEGNKTCLTITDGGAYGTQNLDVNHQIQSIAVGAQVSPFTLYGSNSTELLSISKSMPTLVTPVPAGQSLSIERQSEAKDIVNAAHTVEADQVCFYRYEQFGGQRNCFKAGGVERIDVGVRRIRSILMGQNVRRVRMYSARMKELNVVTSSVAKLEKGKRKFSFVQVEQVDGQETGNAGDVLNPDEVCFYKEKSYKGTRMCYRVGTTSPFRSLNRVRSVLFGAKVQQVTLYRGKKKKQTLTSSTKELKFLTQKFNKFSVE